METSLVSAILLLLDLKFDVFLVGYISFVFYVLAKFVLNIRAKNNHTTLKIPIKSYEDDGLSLPLFVASTRTTNTHSCFEQNFKLFIEELSYPHNYNPKTNPQPPTALGLSSLTSRGGSSFASERERREELNQKYLALRGLIPFPVKLDRASLVQGAIEYIKRLVTSVNDLKLCVEIKKRRKDKSKWPKTEKQDSRGEADPDQSYNNDSLSSSWLHRKSDKDTKVDVRIVRDEVTIKLVQKKKTNCLLVVSKVLDELQLDLHHVAGYQIGEYCSFLFNTKMHKGSLVSDSAIANKLIEVVDNQHASTPPTSCATDEVKNIVAI